MSIHRRILFVCTGNICRSPLAEALLAQKLRDRGVADRFEIDSAGTTADHLGQQSDRRMRQTARRHGVTIDHHARRLVERDVERFDLLIGMDDWHVQRMERMAAGANVEIRKLGEFYPAAGRARLGDSPRTGEPLAHGPVPDVPDPWYGGIEGFEHVYEMVNRACEVLADRLVRELRADGGDASGSHRRDA